MVFVSGGKVRTFSLSLLVITFLGIILPKIKILDSRNQTKEFKVCEIQGNSYLSPLQGEFIQTEGIVVADLDATSYKGFTIQHESCDANPFTSDGIFVYLGKKLDLVDPGDRVLVAGEVEENFGLTRMNVSPTNVMVVAHEISLPAPSVFSPPFDDQESQLYYESHESMLVRVEEALVVGPTNQMGDTWVIRFDLGLERVFHDDLTGTGELIWISNDGLYGVLPGAKVGDRIQNLEGVLDFSLGTYKFLLLSQPILIKIELPDIIGIETSSPGDFSIATFNLKDLFDTYDDPEVEDSILSSGEYQTKLRKLALAIQDGLNRPDLIAVQEVESAETLQALVNRPEINDDDFYEFTILDGPDTRGLDVGLLYHHSRVKVLQTESFQGCTNLIDGLGPDGNLDVTNPDNTTTCDTNGDGVLDGNRLFSRPPLIVRVKFCEGICRFGVERQMSQGRELWLIVNHWISKSHDAGEKAYSLPRRLEQAQFVVGLAEEIQTLDPHAALIILGDFNDQENSEPLARLVEPELANLTSRIPHSDRYSYVYQGVSQTLDHVLVSAWLMSPTQGIFIQPVPINADYPDHYRSDEKTYLRSSDHDPVVLRFVSMEHFYYLPFVRR